MTFLHISWCSLFHSPVYCFTAASLQRPYPIPTVTTITRFNVRVPTADSCKRFIIHQNVKIGSGPTQNSIQRGKSVGAWTSTSDSLHWDEEYFLQAIQLVNLLRINCILLAPCIRLCAQQYVLLFCIFAQISCSAVHFPLIITDTQCTLLLSAYLHHYHCVSHPVLLRLQALTRLFIPVLPSVLPWNVPTSRYNKQLCTPPEH